MFAISKTRNEWNITMKHTLLLFLISLLSAFSVIADTFTWDGGGTGNTWLTAENWSTDTAPSSDGSAILAFSGGIRTSTTNTFTADTAFAGITFMNDYSAGKSAAFTLSGNRLTLGGNITSASTTTTITDTIALNLSLNGTRTLTMNNNHTLTISGVIGDTGSGAYGLIKAGSGVLKLTATNTFTGPVTNNAGYLYFNSIKTIGGGASALGAPITRENGTIRSAGRMYYNGSTSTTTDRPLIVSGDLQFFNEIAGTTLTLDGTITGASVISFRGSGIFSVNGLIALTNDVSRTDNGTVYLNNNANIFTGSLVIKDGIISTATVADGGQVCAIGLGSQIILGQNSPYNTTGTFRFTGVNGGSLNRTIKILSANTTTYGGKIENTVTGQTLTLNGPIVVDSGASKPAPVWLTGAGNGVLSGSIGAGLRLVKTGSGTWTLSGANALTSSVMVSTGTLLVNGSLPAESTVSVEPGATLGGTGTISGCVAVATGGIIAPGSDNAGTLTLANTSASALAFTNCTFACELTGTGIADRLDIGGTLVLNAENVIALQLPDNTAPAGTYTLMTYSALNADNGTLVLDRTYPNATFTVGETNVTLTITGSGTAPNLLWKGDDSANLWNTTADNWFPGPFGNGMVVVFDDTGSDSPEISIDAAGVMPKSVTLTNTTKNYTFSGGAIACMGALTKNGSGLLTLNNPNTYNGPVVLNEGKLTVNAALDSAGITVSAGTILTQNVNAAFSGTGALAISGSATLLGTNSYTGTTTLATGGTLVLGGLLNGSSIMVNSNATFSQSASSGIAGGPSVTVTLQSNATLGGSNSYDGLTTLGVSGIPNLTYAINHSNALGSTVGGTMIYGGTGSLLNRLVLGKNITIANEPLTLNGINDYRSGLSYNQTTGTGTWAGVIACIGSAYIESSTAGGTLAIGVDDTTLVTNAANCSLSMRGTGNILLNSRIRIGTGNSLFRNDSGTLIIASTNNIWGDTGFSEGTIRMNVMNGLPQTTLLSIGKGDKKSLCVFDLNGFDQTIRGLADIHFAGDTGTQRIISNLPATLTISNDTPRTFGKDGSSIEGAVILNKLGVSALTLTSTNLYSGATVISNGTLAVSAGGTLGTNSLSVIIGGSATLILSNSTAIADAAAIYMPESTVTTAKIQLAANVEETVGWLLYGDKFKRTGTYGGANSGADYIDPTHFSGEGKLRVLYTHTGVSIIIR